MKHHTYNVGDIQNIIDACDAMVDTHTSALIGGDAWDIACSRWDDAISRVHETLTSYWTQHVDDAHGDNELDAIDIETSNMGPCDDGYDHSDALRSLAYAYVRYMLRHMA